MTGCVMNISMTVSCDWKPYKKSGVYKKIEKTFMIRSMYHEMHKQACMC